MPKQTFRLNGKTVTVNVNDDVRVLWVLRDLLGVTGPKYGCGINVCKACTSHINGKAFNPCSVRVGDLKKTDRVTTIYCQPGQIMAAVALVRKTRREGRKITEQDLDGIRNICRCGTYTRIREAIEEGARRM
jgi:isoquinoline 1-oxidoreductase alpha subunit